MHIATAILGHRVNRQFYDLHQLPEHKKSDTPGSALSGPVLSPGLPGPSFISGAPANSQR